MAVRSEPAISVVVASHGRPTWLRRCLTALAQLDYPAFEVIVVADQAALGSLARHPALALCRTIGIDEENLSVARNAGARAAAGEIVAFIDDDAVPEPLWLRHHARALTETGAAASVGYVRGRNGISFQSRVQSVDAEAETHEESPEQRLFCIPELKPGRALKLVGTNVAYRRDVFLALGGFDTSFRYFLEDADLSLRLMLAGLVSAVTPFAEVHHGFAPSPRRAASRRPLDLTDIGRSTAIFARRHPSVPQSELLARMVARERARLIRHMVRGTCEPRDVDRLIGTLLTGWEIGLDVDLPEIRALSGEAGDFRAMPPGPADHLVITSRFARRRQRVSEAGTAAEAGQRVSFFSFSLTPVRHHLRYLEPGVWCQTGGQFGRSERSGPLFRWCSFADRLKVEIGRVAKQRGIGETLRTGDAVGPSWTTSVKKTMKGSRPIGVRPDKL